METEPTILALAALAQSTRLDVFRLLVKNEPEGLPAGEIAKALAVPQNTMSAHLAVLSRAGLVICQPHQPFDRLPRRPRAFPDRDVVSPERLLPGTPGNLRAIDRKHHALLSTEAEGKAHADRRFDLLFATSGQEKAS